MQPSPTVPLRLVEGKTAVARLFEGGVGVTSSTPNRCQWREIRLVAHSKKKFDGNRGELESLKHLSD